MKQDPSGLPFVSIVIPILDAEDKIDQCLLAILGQSYPQERFEVFVIDNGSSDQSVSIIKKYPVKLLREHSKKSPYAARNRGLKEASGEIIAFTDADCVPDPGWIENSVRRLKDDTVDMVGGEVKFMYSDSRSSAEIYDSLVNLEMKNNIRKKGVAKTGNLIARRRVFERIGPFPHHIRSGGDVIWTGKATDAGFNLVFDPEVIVYKPARKLDALLKKQFRVGKGQGRIMLRNDPPLRIAKDLIKGFRPLSKEDITGLIKERGQKEFLEMLPKLSVVSLFCRVVTNLGRLYYMGSHFLKRNKEKE